MNERIYEFADRAGEYADFESGICTDEFLEKFAELIIQECLLAISKTPELFTEEEVAVMVKCHNHVEKHFGVK